MLVNVCSLRSSCVERYLEIRERVDPEEFSEICIENYARRTLPFLLYSELMKLAHFNVFTEGIKK